jgi:hypothetical protein
MNEVAVVGYARLSDLEIALGQRDALARACQRALVDLKAARILAQHTLGEPHGINQTIEIVESALEGYQAAVGSSGDQP